MLREGSIVDATIISAPSSTKNSTGKRDRVVGPPEMHQARKGNEWHFGMKMHIGVDDTLGLIHGIDTTAANVHDIVPTDKLLHGEEQRIFGGAGYLGLAFRSGMSISTVKTSPGSLPNGLAPGRSWMPAN